MKIPSRLTALAAIPALLLGLGASSATAAVAHPVANTVTAAARHGTWQKLPTAPVTKEPGMLVSVQLQPRDE